MITSKFRRAAALAVMGLAAVAVLAACHGSSSTPAGGALHSLASNGQVHTALTADEQAGIAHLEQCLPNGTAMIAPLLNGTASVLTAVQVYHTFHGGNLVSFEQNCLPPSASGHPLHHAVKLFEKCFKGKAAAAVQKATQPFLQHPILDRKQIEQGTGRATILTAASCVNTVVKAH